MPTPSAYANGKSFEYLSSVMEGERTQALPLLQGEGEYAGSFVLTWDARVEALLKAVIERWIEVSQAEQTAWPTSEEFEYRMEMVSGESVKRIKMIRGVEFSRPETSVVYAEDELDQFF